MIVLCEIFEARRCEVRKLYMIEIYNICLSTQSNLLIGISNARKLTKKYKKEMEKCMPIKYLRKKSGKNEELTLLGILRP